jgi:GMP reductase
LLEDTYSKNLEEVKSDFYLHRNKKILEIKSQLSNYYIDYRNIFVSFGTSDKDKEKLKKRIEQESRIKSVCIDVANGYRLSVFDYVKEIRNSICKNKILMVGNIATEDAFLEYSNLNVDIVKAGIGQGSACTTRIETGVGVPQLTMITEIKKSIIKYKANLLEQVEKYEITLDEKTVDFNDSEHLKHCQNVSKLRDKIQTLLCADGGITKPADIAKAFVADADFVMIGGMFAGHEESPGKIEIIDGKKMIRFSGMASLESQWNGVPEYGTAEGKTVMIPYKGKVKNTIQRILGGVRSACTYTNSKNIKDLNKSIFIKTHIQENKILN